MDSFIESPESLLRRICSALKVAAWFIGVYLFVSVLFSATAFFSIINGNAEIEYWGPVHWPLKLLQFL